MHRLSNEQIAGRKYPGKRGALFFFLFKRAHLTLHREFPPANRWGLRNSCFIAHVNRIRGITERGNLVTKRPAAEMCTHALANEFSLTSDLTRPVKIASVHKKNQTITGPCERAMMATCINRTPKPKKEEILCVINVGNKTHLPVYPSTPIPTANQPTETSGSSIITPDPSI